MRQKSVPEKEPATQVVKDIRRATRRHFSAEDKIRIVLEGPARRGQHRRALPARRDCPEPLLPLVEGVSRGRQEAAGRRYGAGGHLGRGQGPAARGQRAEGGRGRADPGEPSAQKKRDGGWGGRRMRYPASEKLEIIRLVEQSHLPVRPDAGRSSASPGRPSTVGTICTRGGRRPSNLAAAGSGLEPHPRRCPRADQGPGAR